MALGRVFRGLTVAGSSSRSILTNLVLTISLCVLIGTVCLESCAYGVCVCV